MRFFVTALILLAITAFVSWLNYRLLTRIFAPYRTRAVKYAYLFFTLATIAVMGYGWPRRPPLVVQEIEVFHIFVYGALAWSFGQFILLIFQPLLYVAHRLIRGRQAAQVPADTAAAPAMTRREFFHRTLAVAPLIAFGVSSQGVYGAQNQMAVQRYSLALPDLPPDLSGFKIAQVSDIHLGPYFDLARLDTVIRMLAEEKPDLVAITGDFSDDLTLLGPAIDRFDRLQPSVPHGIYFCMGNHDYFRSAERVRSALNNSRVVLLDNASRPITAAEKPFYLMGVDYPWEDVNRSGINVSTGKRMQCFAAAARDVPPDAFRVLIGHHPDVLFDGFAAKVPLTLTGHTHGGQVVIGGKSLLSSYRYMRGLYHENGVYGYVSSGTGHWFPFRLGCPAEIGVFTLQA
ncbi:MAG: metallophosphoesterase [Negativicutes bacterium]|nr:metallophosphoesterase [Negativicutes bacterium]